MKAYERFLRLIAVPSRSSETTGTHPSTEGQIRMAELLCGELKEIGASDIFHDGRGYVYAKLPATEGYEDAPAIGLISHIDTSPDYAGEGINPRFIEDYDGKDVPLGDSGKVLSVSDFPHLRELAGRTLIVTDGRTLLGADDKAGVAEILQAVEETVREGTPHGTVCIGFTPDEEIGEGADLFDVSRFGADFAYTVDGDREGDIEYENFNAASACVTVHGKNVHPGSAYGIMVNSQLVAAELIAALPKDETPSTTRGYEGFFHLCEMEGNVEKSVLRFIVRDHDAGKYEEKLVFLASLCRSFDETYGDGTVELSVKEQYRNMKEVIETVPYVVEIAREAAKDAGLISHTNPIRGGTDGARLSFMGLPCPNIGTGGYAFHGPFEHITVEGMDGAVRMLRAIIGRASRMKKR